MKKHILFLIATIALNTAQATEGMWIPSLLGAVYDDMKAYGLQLTEEDLYSVNKSSLKDAIVLFDGGCTAEIVSNEGLLFTNHHCGLDYIQFHSSLQHDYLKDGFWAMNRNEELICSGLSVVFIVRMDDVTARMRKGITATLTQKETEALVAANRKELEAEYKKNNPGLGLQIKAFNYGNQFFAILTKSYNDVRMVGAPPGAIGKFGGDTDNWVWPRHTGDFSVFRIYADKNNEPAAYSADNVPYKPAHYLPINVGGAHQGDYSMVYGFPGRTDHLLTSYAVQYQMEKGTPMRIKMRDASLEVIDERMRSSDELRIKYAAKQSGIANGWKKWKGQMIGLTNIRAVNMKQTFEKEYQAKTAKPEYTAYSGLLAKLDSLYKLIEPYVISRDLYAEYISYGPELFGFAYSFHELVDNYDTLHATGELEESIQLLKENARRFYKDFDKQTEHKLWNKMTNGLMYYNMNDGAFLNHTPPMTEKMESGKDFYKSIFMDSTTLFKMLDSFGKSSVKKMKKDYFYSNAALMNKAYSEKINPRYSELNAQINFAMQQYTEGMMLMFPADYWADANSTLRITFGKVDGSTPRDGEHYNYFTTADGMLEKYYTKNPDFELNPKLISLLEKHEYGNYGEDGELRLCYTGSNHTTGGNSGSPALNAKGELTGINFDRSWESTMSDIVYNPDICRNIMVDVRFVLWTIDVYAGAGYLLKEMTLVK
ncbi:MAG: S46 family peptidase [Flavobacteriales bacterium]